MTLTLGASHVFTTPGIVSVTRPLGLSIHCTGVPNYVPRDAYMPTEYWGIGRISVGNALGYLPHVELVGGAQLVLPLPDDLTVLSCSQKSGITVTVDEIVRPAVLNSALQPWDRGRSAIGTWNNVIPTPGGAVVQLWTYTVPAGRILYVGSLSAAVTRMTAPTTPGQCRSWVYRSGNAVVYAEISSGTVGSRATDAIGGPLFLTAGETLVANGDDASVAGVVHAYAAFSGFLFDV